MLGVPTIRRIKSQLSGAIAEESPDAIWQRLQDLRDDYYRYVDIGESSTYAAALTLQMPTTSNDGNAIRTLLNNDVEVPVPVLRMFDLVAFAVQSGEMSVDAADDLRSRLLAAKEHVPKAFLNAGFADGLEAFRPRLVDGSSRCSVRVANDVVVLTPR
ncbi:hypothetical protein DB32_005989 [Sandaracinus amylolyticus]|uniref:Uncharacterized protein n=1 Tax=Sandaracinus amylolyticus TaxID=927083 RepID=A0A0F6W6Y2_9BACT|nr:hypothetical protein DB32_005989 [Sandaracinus amylolyticus]